MRSVDYVQQLGTIRLLRTIFDTRFLHKDCRGNCLSIELFEVLTILFPELFYSSSRE